LSSGDFVTFATTGRLLVDSNQPISFGQFPASQQTTGIPSTIKRRARARRRSVVHPGAADRAVAKQVRVLDPEQVRVRFFPRGDAGDEATSSSTATTFRW